MNITPSPGPEDLLVEDLLVLVAGTNAPATSSPATDARGDRCLDAGCFAGQKAPSVQAVIAMAQEKHGEQLAVERSSALACCGPFRA